MPLFFLVVSLLFPPGRLAADDYVEGLVRLADALALHEERYWEVLLHYKPGWLGVRSEVDDPRFFNAPGGKTDPRAELHATIRAFFQPVDGEDVEHPRCRFQARFEWLDGFLEFDREQLPMAECATYQRVYNHLRPVSATMAFPAAYLNGPASMFGHTLVVFDTKDRNRLLARAVSYAALTGQTFGPFFAFGGLFGLFRGYYSVQPYYDKVEEYGDIGRRDVWEYELDFNQEEVDRMMAHTWELRDVYSDYFFFTENCSYNVLWLLEAARPSLRLTDQFRSWVIPIDTVKAIRKAELIRDINYRPSPKTRIQHLASLLPESSRQLAREVGRGDRPPGDILGEVPGEEARKVTFDLASEFCQDLYTERLLSEDDYRKTLLPMLKLRSKLGPPTEAMTVPRPSHPEDGHEPTRLAAGAGVDNGDAFLALRYRAVYHGHDDHDRGYTPGAQLELGKVEGRFYLDDERFELEHFEVVSVRSVAPRDKFFKPYSWKVEFGFEQMDFEEDEEDLVFSLNTGSGLAYDVPRVGLTWVMLEAEGQLGQDYGDDYAAGLGPSLGVIRHWNDRSKFNLETRIMRYGFREHFTSYSVSARQSFYWGVNRSLSLEFLHEGHDDFTRNEGRVFGRLYF